MRANRLSLLLVPALLVGCSSHEPGPEERIAPQAQFHHLLDGVGPLGLELGEPVPQELLTGPTGKVFERWLRDGELLRVEARLRGGDGGVVQLLEAVVCEEDPVTLEYLGVKRGAPLGVAEGRYRSRGGQAHRVHERYSIVVFATDRPSVYVTYQLPMGTIYSIIRVLDGQALASRGLVTVEAYIDDQRASAKRGGLNMAAMLDGLRQLCGDLPGLTEVRAEVEQAEAARNLARQRSLEVGLEQVTSEWPTASSRRRLELLAALRPKLLGGRGEELAAGERRWAELLERARLEAAEPASGPALVWFHLLAQPNAWSTPAKLLAIFDEAAKLDSDDGAAASVDRLIVVSRLLPGSRLAGVAERHRAITDRAIGRRVVRLRAAGEEEEALLEAANLPFPNDVRMSVGPLVSAIAPLKSLRGDPLGQAMWLQRAAREPPAGHDGRPHPVWPVAMRSIGRWVAGPMRPDARGHLAAGRRATAAGLWLVALSLEGSTAELRDPAAAARTTGQRDSDELQRALVPLLAVIDPPLDQDPDGLRLLERLGAPPGCDRPVTRLAGLLPCHRATLLAALGPGEAQLGWTSLRPTGAGPSVGYELVVGSRRPSAAEGTLDYSALPWFGVTPETRRENDRLEEEKAAILADDKAIEEERAAIEAETERLRTVVANLEHSSLAPGDPRRGDEIARTQTEVLARDQRIAAFNGRVARLESRRQAYNHGVNAYNLRLNRERFGELQALDAKLDRALTDHADRALAAWANGVRARLGDDALTAREIAWARWLFGRGADGPPVGPLGSPAAFKERRAAWTAEAAFRQPTAEAAARLVVELWELDSPTHERARAAIARFLTLYDDSALVTAAAMIPALRAAVSEAIAARKR